MQQVYADRRSRTVESLGDGVLVLFGAPVAIRNNDVEHEYRQDSDFYYLTGLEEPECALVLSGNSEKTYTLFVRPRDEERETWDGERTGVEGAVTRYGADVAHPISELADKLLELLKGKQRLFYAIGRHHRNDEVVFEVLSKLRARSRRGEISPTSIVEPSTILHEMRLIKSEQEVESIRRAVSITRDAHHALLSCTRPKMTEFELEAVLRAEFRRKGSQRCAYEPIVAAGPNARVLHYRRNDAEIDDGALILVDAGAEYQYMASDITRTFPANGRFDPLQRKAYEVVLRAQLAAIAAIAPGANLDDVHFAAVRELCSGLIELGILSGSGQQVLEADAYKKYYMHRTSHWMGMDVHDVGAYYASGKPRSLEAGMVLTVEPGLYFPASDEMVPRELRNLGIRIEDDVLVTTTGAENLSEGIAKTVSEIESLMAQGRAGECGQ